MGGCRPGIRKWVRHNFKCKECESNKMKGVRIPTTMVRCYVFNRVVGCDTVKLSNWNKTTKHAWLNKVCWGIRWSVATKSSTQMNPTSAGARNAWMSGWVRHYGDTEVDVTDQGKEFMGEYAE